ncbi:hypothetical protein ACQ5SO_08615 [Rhodovulum sp. DZ06]|uniref:hypothetical protein n=1 Tax=Rhodovulum sp. DZ06 TaxID=3425126 RepID=UPI003D349084
MKTAGWILRAAWLGACLFALSTLWRAGAGFADGQAAVVLMLLLTAPLGVLAAAPLMWSFGAGIMAAPAAAVAVWALAAAAGYAQWFILLPRAFRRLVFGKPPARDDHMTTGEARDG